MSGAGWNLMPPLLGDGSGVRVLGVTFSVSLLSIEVLGEEGGVRLSGVRMLSCCCSPSFSVTGKMPVELFT